MSTYVPATVAGALSQVRLRGVRDDVVATGKGMLGVARESKERRRVVAARGRLRMTHC